MSRKYISSGISGLNLKCKMAFPKIYFTGKAEDVYERVYYDIGFLAELAWENSANLTLKTTLSTKQPFDIASGVSVLRGQMVLKVFYKDSLEALKEEIAKGINHGEDKMMFPVINDSPFVTLDEPDDTMMMSSHSDASIVDWGSMPLFDLILINQYKNEFNKTTVVKAEIRKCRFESIGFSESAESLESNIIASFMAIGEVKEWEEVGDADENAI